MPSYPYLPKPNYKRKKTYTIKMGDTLSSLASRYGVPITQLAQANQGVGITPGNVIVIPTVETAQNKNTLAYNYPVNNKTKLPTAASLTASIRKSQGIGYGKDRGGLINYSYLGAPTQPTKTVLPDIYYAQPNAPAIEYQKKRLQAFEEMGIPAPSVNVDVAKIIEPNDAVWVQAGYIKNGDTWVYTRETAGIAGGVKTTGNKEAPDWASKKLKYEYENYKQWAEKTGREVSDFDKYLADKYARGGGDYWGYMQEMQMGQPSGGGIGGGGYERNRRQKWQMFKARRLAEQQKHGVGGSDIGYANAEYSTTAIQPLYNNNYYSMTGRSYTSAGGLITWRT